MLCAERTQLRQFNLVAKRLIYPILRPDQIRRQTQNAFINATYNRNNSTGNQQTKRQLADEKLADEKPDHEKTKTDERQTDGKRRRCRSGDSLRQRGKTRRCQMQKPQPSPAQTKKPKVKTEQQIENEWPFKQQIRTNHQNRTTEARASNPETKGSVRRHHQDNILLSQVKTSKNPSN